MRTRASHFPIAFLLGLALCLQACAPRPATSVTPIAAHPVEPPPAKPAKLAKAKRTDPNCAAARIDLSSDRKEALFRQFEAEMGPALPAALATDSGPAVPLALATDPGPAVPAALATDPDPAVPSAVATDPQPVPRCKPAAK